MLNHFNTLRPRQNGLLFTDIFKCIFLNKKVQIFMPISLKLVPKSPINNKSALVQMMATSHDLNQWWLRLPTHMCVTRPQWVKFSSTFLFIMRKCSTDVVHDVDLLTELPQFPSFITHFFIPIFLGQMLELSAHKNGEAMFGSPAQTKLDQ